jgi:hypothetical protein
MLDHMRCNKNSTLIASEQRPLQLGAEYRQLQMPAQILENPLLVRRQANLRPDDLRYANSLAIRTKQHCIILTKQRSKNLSETKNFEK